MEPDILHALPCTITFLLYGCYNARLTNAQVVVYQMDGIVIDVIVAEDVPIISAV